jgi:aryl-alcohol dehydrogenase-like predicted oxidoreductase
LDGNAQQAAVVDTVLAIAAELGITAVQVSLAWLRRRASIAPTALIPILGPRTQAHLEEYLRPIELGLDDEQYRRLEEASAIRLGTPHDDVAAALNSGFDGDRTLLREASPVPVI